MDSTRVFAEELGARLFRARLKQKISLETLAKVKKWNLKELEAWECGEAVPTIQQLRDLSIMYRVSLDYLVSGIPMPRGDSDRESHVSALPILSGFAGGGVH